MKITTTMTVNGVNISTYNAKFWSIEPGKRNISNSSESLGAGMPLMLPPEYGLKEYTLELHVYGGSRGEIWENASGILSLFYDVADVMLHRNEQRFYKLSLSGVTQAEYGAWKDRWHTLTLVCVGYEYGHEMETRVSGQDLFGIGGTNTITVYYDAYVKDMAVNPSAGAAKKTTAIVPVNVTILRPDIDPETGRYPPMNCNMKINGLCKNRRGKDVGELELEVRPYVMDFSMGAASVTVDGMTGETTVKPNYDNQDRGSYDLYCKSPAPLMWGYPGQKISIELTAYEESDNPVGYNVHFSYTPVFL